MRGAVAVVGAGVIGGWVAHDLSKAGIETVIIDPAAAAGSSAGNAGLLVPSYCLPLSNPSTLLRGIGELRRGGVTLARPVPLRWLGRFVAASRPGRARRDAVVLRELAEQSIERWASLDGVLTRSGWTWLYRARADAERQQRASAALGVRGLLVEDPEPALAGSHMGLLFPDDCSVDPAVATRAVVSGAIGHGAQLRPTSVVSATRSAAGWEVACSDGSCVMAEKVVIAAGHRSRAVGRLFGVDVPVEPGYGSSLTFQCEAPVLSRPVLLTQEHVVLSPLPGRLRATGGMTFGGSADRPQDIERLRVVVRALLPCLNTRGGSPWHGARPMTPTCVPEIGDRGRGVVVATGHGTLGMTLAPSAASQALRLITNS